jgi:hypothetical protein
MVLLVLVDGFGGGSVAALTLWAEVKLRFPTRL